MAKYTDDDVRRAIKRLAAQERAEARKSGTIIAVNGRKVSVVVDGENSLLSAHRGNYEPVVGMRVTIELVPGTTFWKVVGVADDSLASNSENPYDIEYIGTPLYYPVALEAVNNAAYNLSATGLEITVYNIHYVTSDGVYHFDHTNTLDLAAHVPGTDSRWVIIYVDASDGTVTTYLAAPTTTPNGEWVDAANAMIAADSNKIPLLAVRLDAGMTAWGDNWKKISRGYNYNNRMIIRIPYQTQTSSAYHLVEENGTPLTPRDTLNFVDGNYTSAVVTDNGGAGSSDITFDVPVMTGASSTADGAVGLVPQPLKDEEGLFLRGDGTWAAGGGGAAAFTDLTDVPASYTGESLKLVRVNAGETALEFVANTSSGVIRMVPTLLARTVLAAAGNFDFTSIPSTYKHLQVVARLRGDTTASTTDVAYMFLNNDTTTNNYLAQVFAVQNGSSNVTESAAPLMAVIPASGTNNATDSFAWVNTWIPDYADSKRKISHNDFSCEFDGRTTTTGALYNGRYSTAWRVNTAINRITIQPDGYSTDKFAIGSYVEIWGWKEEFIGGEDYASAHTTDATITTAASVVVAEGTSGILTGRVVAKKSDESAGLCATFLAGVRRATAGNATLVGSATINVIEDSGSSPTVSIDADTGTQTIRIRVTGVASEVWEWDVYYEYSANDT